MTDSAAKVFYEFSDFRLDPLQRLLLARRDGRPVPLPPKAFETLLYFVERRGELLDKATLLKAVWPNVVVEENSLNQNISLIRRALGESPGEHRFIVTEPGRGYRFVADVGVVAAPARAEFAAPSTAVTQTSGASPRERKSIAVLAFANLTGDPAKEYFSDGMSEELLHTLARIPGLKVPSRTSSFAYKGRNVDVRQIARDLEVGVVLEGSVRSAGERVRVTAQLIDGSNGYHLWSQHYDREFGDLFALQDEIAQAIVRTLRVTLDGDTAGSELVGHLLHERPTRDLEAYHLYLQALAVLAIVGDSSLLLRAVAMLQKAIARDPGFARAHNAIAALRALAIVFDVRLPGTLAEAEADVLRGLALDPSLGATHASLGIIYAAQGKWLSAEERFHEAFARDAGDPMTSQAYGLYLVGSVGFLRRYAQLTLETHQLAPAWVPNLMNVAVAHMLIDDSETAYQFAALGRDLGLPPTIGPLPDMYAQLAVREGRYDDAPEFLIAALPPAMAADGSADTVREVFRVLRDRASSGPMIEALDAWRARTTPADMTQMMKRRFMVWYTQLGALDRAFAVANESLDHFAQTGTIGVAWTFLWMREMLPFRQHAAFQSLCRRMHMFEYWNKYGPPDQCELHDGALICR